jgi:hypothetical protein
MHKICEAAPNATSQAEEVGMPCMPLSMAAYTKVVEMLVYTDIMKATYWYPSYVVYSFHHPLPLPKLTSGSQEIRLPQRHTLHATDRVCRCAMKVEVRYHILPQIHRAVFKVETAPHAYFAYTS